MVNKKGVVAVSSAKSVSSSVPVHKDRKKIIGIVVVTVVVVLLIGVLMFMGKGKFAGKAIETNFNLLTDNQGGFPYKADAKGMEAKDQTFTVYANLGQDDGYAFVINLEYDPAVLKYVKSYDRIKTYKKDIVVLQEEDNNINRKQTVTISGAVIALTDDETDLKTLGSLKDLKNQLVPLVDLKFERVKEADTTTLHFKDLNVLGINSNNNILTQKPVDISFKVSPIITCNNNKLEAGESCDGTELGNNACPEGTSGSVTCKNDCSGVDTSLCVASVATTTSQKETFCTNGQDDDGDGLIDCVDSDCLFTDPCDIDGDKISNKFDQTPCGLNAILKNGACACNEGYENDDGVWFNGCEAQKVEASCGNGVKNVDKNSLSRWEACDDGNVQSGDGCSSTCAIEDGYNCILYGQNSCFKDADKDGKADEIDNCLQMKNPDQSDKDGDKVGDVCDNTPCGANADLINSMCVCKTGFSDKDRSWTTGCEFDESDTDGDGIFDDADGKKDNCPTVSNVDQKDFDNDGVGDACTATGDVCLKESKTPQDHILINGVAHYCNKKGDKLQWLIGLQETCNSDVTCIANAVCDTNQKKCLGVEGMNCGNGDNSLCPSGYVCDTTVTQKCVKETKTVTSLGDENNDNVVDIFDVLVIVDYINNPTGTMPPDVNCDGTVDIFDALAIVDAINAGKTLTCPSS